MTIVAATDFSEIAENALEYAASAAKIANAKLFIYNSFKLSIHAANAHLPEEVFQNLFNTNNVRLKNRSESISNEYGIEVHYKSSYSFIEDELNLLIKEYDVELIVMGMNDKTLEQDLIGNTTTSAIKNLGVPILAVPLNAKFEGTHKILFACDIVKDVPEKVLDRIKQTALKLNGEVEIFSVNTALEKLRSEDPGALAVNAIDKNLQGINYYYKNVQSNAVIKEIEKEIKEFKADILIMMPKQYGFWESFVHRSKTRIMASGLNIPLLSLPE